MNEQDDFLFEEEQLDFLELSMRRLSFLSFLAKCLTVLALAAALLGMQSPAGPALSPLSIVSVALLWLADARIGYVRGLHSALYLDVLHGGDPARDLALRQLSARFPGSDMSFGHNWRALAWFYLPFALTALLLTAFRASSG